MGVDNTLDKVNFIYAIYKNETNGYCTYLYKHKDARIRCVGLNLPENKTLTYKFNGNWNEHKKYGLQFVVDSYETVIDNDRTGIVSYLSSGLIKGIGVKLAERIYDKFKENSLEILKNNPRRLLEIKGITPKKLDKIIFSYKNSQSMEDLMLYLSPMGFTPKMISKIHDKYKEDTMKIVKENPYALMDIKGITFPMVDVLGKSLDFTGMNHNRVLAAAKSVMRDNLVTGSVGITKEELIYGNNMFTGLLSKLGLGLSDSTSLWKIIVSFIKDEKIAYSKILDKEQNIIQYFYEPNIKNIELELKTNILRHLKKNEISSEKIERLIEKYSKDINLDFSQKSAIINAFTSNLSIITGGPGTGKTTIISMIGKIAKELEPKETVEYMAPTGKAARRMSESTGEVASTIHHRLKLGIHDENAEYTEETEIIEGGTVIIDEFSMVDMFVAHKLFSSINNARIILVGDKNQLASVGAGNVLKDLIATNMIPTVYLKYVHRQGVDSLICKNAENMQKGITILEEGTDFKCNWYTVNSTYIKALEDDMVKTYVEEINTYGIENVVCLCPYKEYDAGVFSINKRIQDIVNPLNNRIELHGRNNISFRVNDLIIQLKNKEEVLNGDIGKIIEISESENKVYAVAEFDNGHTETYTSENVEEITLAYAMSVHKCQGSEYDSVLMCLTPFHRKMLKRNVLYTGATRAKKQYTLFSTIEAVETAIKNNSIEERHTLLKDYLLKHAKETYEQIKFSGM